MPYACLSPGTHNHGLPPRSRLSNLITFSSVLYTALSIPLARDMGLDVSYYVLMAGLLEETHARPHAGHPPNRRSQLPHIFLLRNSDKERIYLESQSKIQSLPVEKNNKTRAIQATTTECCTNNNQHNKYGRSIDRVLVL